MRKIDFVVSEDGVHSQSSSDFALYGHGEQDDHQRLRMESALLDPSVEVSPQAAPPPIGKDKDV
jgi:hypothetical protein